jgi:hypothetical protein
MTEHDPMTSGSGATLLGELLEDQATGEIAAIYAEIRQFSGVPYVSSLQRYLATMPGVLEWAWRAVRPAMVSGVIPETGWRLAQAVRIPPLPPVSAAVLRSWGVDAAGLTAIRNIAENFVRVSPVNLMTGACLRLLLTGARPAGAGFAESWAPPTMLAPMPGNIDPAALSPDRQAVLMQLATEMDGKPFVPALYRQLAHWPAFLAWIATELSPRFAAPETGKARAAFRDASWTAAPAIVARLPGLPDLAPPDPAAVARILASIEGYAATSPEMVMFGRLILDALPENMQTGIA